MSNEENVTLQNAEDSADKEQQKEQTPDMQEPQTDKPVEGTQSDTSADISDDSAKSDDVAPAPEKKSDKPDKQKTRAVSAGKSAAEKRKLFKVIYYPVLALFVMLMLVFSVIDGAFGYSPAPYGDAY